MQSSGLFCLSGGKMQARSGGQTKHSPIRLKQYLNYGNYIRLTVSTGTGPYQM